MKRIKDLTIDLLAPVRLGLGIVALIATFKTVLFFPMLYLFIQFEIRAWVKFRGK